MEEVIKVLNEAIFKSTINDLKRFIEDNATHDKWLIYSDYCIGDKNKPNDVVSFSVMPYDDYPENIKDKIFLLAQTDIKNKRSINPDFIAYLKEKRLFHINFILGSRKGLTKIDGFDEKQTVFRSIENTKDMLGRWCMNTPSNADYFKKIIKKLNMLKNKMNKKSANYKLFQDVTLISLLAGYICYLFTKFASAKIIGWFSDRDKIIESYDMIASNLFDLNHHSICERDSIDSSSTQLVFGIPKEDEDGKVWYDDMNRLPDHIAGTISDWDIVNNWSSKEKFVAMLEDCLSDNPYLVILKLSLEPKSFQCSRIGVFKK